MNEPRELSPTQESHDPQPDRTTVHIQEPTVAGADGTEAPSGGEPDTEALAGDEAGAKALTDGEPDTEAAAGGEAGSEAPTDGVTDKGPGATGTWTGTRETCDPASSPSSPALSFHMSAPASDSGEVVDQEERQPSTAPAPRGESTDQDETGDFISVDRTTPPTDDTAPDRAKSPRPRSARIGPDLPGYVILDVIGRGGMGVVYKATQIGLDRLVALKMVLAGGHASPEQLARFSIESQAVAQIQHPGIVQIYEVGEHDGLPYFSLEFVAGGSLAKKIDGKPQPTHEAAAMVRDLALAMRKAHRRNIIHRDLKPANVLLTPDGQPKIADFGLAKRLDADSQQTHTGAIMGTPSYMAPEQAWGQTHETGPLTDLYALGAILYEMLVGRPPFQGASALETLELVRSQEPVPPTRLQPKIPVDLETICLKCLQKDPAKRYQGALELADDLQRFLEGRPILARPVGAGERLWRWCRRNKKVAALVAAVALLLVTVTAVSSYAAVTLKRLNGQLGESIKAETSARVAESAAKEQAQIKEREAVKARDREALARQKESEARQKAENLVRLALKQNTNALDSQRTFSVLFLQRLRDIAGTQDLQNELIRTSVKDVSAIVEVIEQLGAVGAEDKEGAATATRTLARINQQAGRLMENYGRYNEAIRFYRQMDELAESLAAANPEQIDARKPLASSKITIGQFEMNRLGDSKAALLHLEQNLSLRREFLGDKPSDEEAKRGVSNALGLLARVWLKLGDPQKASDYYKEEAALRGQIGGGLADEVEFRREGAGLEEKLGDMYVGLDNKSAAREHYNRSLEIREQIVRQNPSHNQAQRDLLLSYNKLGTFHLLHGKDASAARAFFEKALAEFERRLEAEPENIVAMEDLAATHYFVATAAFRMGDRKAAALHYKACLTIREGMPGDAKAKLQNIDLMLARARCGQHQEAAKIAEKLISAPPLDARVYFFAACGFSLCAGAVAEEHSSSQAKALALYAACGFSLCAGALVEEHSSSQAKALAGSYTESAFKSLRLALGAGWNNLVNVQTDPDLDAVRSAPGFEAVVAEYKKAAGK